jgi:hypothetical protein
MLQYQIKKADDLQTQEIETILKHWEIAEWRQLSKEEFKKIFTYAEFHLLTDENFKILAVARINFDFKIKVEDQIYEIAELVGLVAIEKRSGYGRKLLQEIVTNLKNRNIEAIGFCEKENRPFYYKCQIWNMRDQAKQLREPAGEKWLIPEDDDVLAINLSEKNALLLQSLSPDKLGYLLFA